MRFFSNDARESTDEQSAEDRAKDQAHDEQPDRAQSDPVAVPSQRPPSPWSNTPVAADDPARTDAERRGADADAVADATEPPPTAFGAATVGGGDAAPAGKDGEVVTSSTNTYAGSTADSAPDTVPATWTEHGTRDPDDVVDVPLDDKPGADTTPDSGRDANQDDSVTTYGDPDGTKTDVLKDDSTLDDPKTTDPETTDPGTVGSPEAADSTVDDDDRAGPTVTDAGPLKDDGGFDDPAAVDPVTETPLDATGEPDDSAPPAVVAAPVATAPAAAATAGPADTLFDQDDAKGFQERWRDVQLRFVDSPKDAAGDAGKLVDEAVEKLTASLRAQREGLHNDTEDTEQLRVQLRGYRDILNRILSL